MPDLEPEAYSNVRDPEVLGGFIGKRLCEITQQDQDEWEEDRRSYVQFHFDDGSYLKFYIGDEGFEVHEVMAEEAV